ncbi:phosphopantetheine-binding protein [Paenibacillus sp. FSL H7-0716]|uniref:Carrier domain-containing protein n=1 Tax=Paenibacillus odorifer TaxID=189426 RepID=A0AB36JL57_9BACL|nr:phosphopantetheine-binding protein [Paenibacillus odorifer]OME23558.1 hypothetical protein BSK47_03640 [Paenibacillus odorifer]
MISTIRKVINEYIAEDLAVDVADIDNGDDLTFIGMDSLNLTHLIVGLEKEFNIEFDDEYLEMNNFKTIKSIYNIITRIRG